MVLPLDNLTYAQKCAAFGVAVDFSGCNNEITEEEMHRLGDYMDDFRRNLGIRRADIEDFMKKMEANGRLSYAIKVLKTNQNDIGIWAIYEWLYGVVRILQSPKGLSELDKLYIEEFGWDEQKIRNYRQSHNLPDTITISKKENVSYRNNYPVKNSGCAFLTFAILSSFMFCLFGLIILFI